jgi:hypothetical protein
MGDDRTILFLCPHYAAKSVIGAACCERRAADRGASPLRSWPGPHGWSPWGVTSVTSPRQGSSSSTGMTCPHRAPTSRARVPSLSRM